MSALAFFALIFMSREKFFYYLFVFTLDKIYVGLFKLYFADPRPYMASDNVKPYSCSKGLGNPSGHSSASQVFGFVILLDLFHGRSVPPGEKYSFYSWLTYLTVLALAILWATLIPYSRFMLGVHSADQIVYGVTLGWWTVFTCHFVARDHLIKHIADVRAEALSPLQLRKNALRVLAFFFLYELVSILTFNKVN